MEEAEGLQISLKGSHVDAEILGILDNHKKTTIVTLISMYDKIEVFFIT